MMAVAGTKTERMERMKRRRVIAMTSVRVKRINASASALALTSGWDHNHVALAVTRVPLNPQYELQLQYNKYTWYKINFKLCIERVLLCLSAARPKSRGDTSVSVGLSVASDASST